MLPSTTNPGFNSLSELPIYQYPTGYKCQIRVGNGWPEAECVYGDGNRSVMRYCERSGKVRYRLYEESIGYRPLSLKALPTYLRAPVIQVESYRSGGWYLRLVRGLGIVDGGSVAGLLTGTADALANGLGYANWRTQDGFGVLLDRLQECPEEVEGMDARDVFDAVTWLRNSLQSVS